MSGAFRHFRTITHHKRLVLEGCFKIGLYRQGILHDMSKYSPTEFLVGARYYQGTRSPNNAEREEKTFREIKEKLVKASGRKGSRNKISQSDIL